MWSSAHQGWSTNRLHMSEALERDLRLIYIITDTQTGLEYLYASSGYGVALTPMLPASNEMSREIPDSLE